ncbi:MAG: hypothetical protein HFE42_02755 [Clostridia bacterium]|jgi:electron transport complex protein RnfA|nr:hypothetical protein [Clostridia bacterium]
MATFIAIVLSAVLTNNFITVKTYGVCPFLGVSKKTSSALGMGVAVTVVMVLATLVTYPIYTYVMVPLNFEFLEIIFFIFIIASLVQMLEVIIRKISPTLYNAMGVYLPLITTNCAVLGVTELLIGDMSAILGEGVAMNIGWAVLYALFAGLGFTLVMIIMSGMREKLNYYKTPKALAGFPIAMVTACFICMAFTVFSYIS